MKKIIMLILSFAIVVSLTACGQPQSQMRQTDPAPTEDTTPTTEATEPTEPPVEGFTIDLFYSRLKTYSMTNGLDSVPRPETKAGKKNGETVTTFQCVNGLVSVEAYAIDDCIYQITTACVPAIVAQKLSSSTLAKAAVSAYAYCMIPLFGCEPDLSENWHQTQFYAAPNEGTSDAVIRTYNSDNWLYIAMINETFVSCIATKYCSQCKNNAPNVTFSPGAALCDNCCAPAEKGVDLAQALDISKVWKIETRVDESDMTFHYAFSEDGTCHLLLSDGFSACDGGKGTYQIDGNILSFSMVVAEETYDYSYTYDPQTGNLVYTSGTPLLSQLEIPGDTYPLLEDTINDTAKVIQLAEAFSDGYNGEHG